MEAFQVHFDKENITKPKEKDLLHVKKNTTAQWLNSLLKDIKNAIDIVLILILI
jgi:hypothetical protein